MAVLINQLKGLGSPHVLSNSPWRAGLHERVAHISLRECATSARGLAQEHLGQQVVGAAGKERSRRERPSLARITMEVGHGREAVRVKAMPRLEAIHLLKLPRALVDLHLPLSDGLVDGLPRLERLLLRAQLVAMPKDHFERKPIRFEPRSLIWTCAKILEIGRRAHHAGTHLCLDLDLPL